MKLVHLVVAGTIPLALSACSDRMIMTEPSHSASEAVASADKGGTSDRTVNLMDACDPVSFAANGVPCTRNGGVSFDDLVAQLTAHGSAGAWHFAPSQMDAKVGLTLFATNNGGEVHTFTKVAAFGGGFIDFLNGLSNNPVPAPECLALENDDLIAPGGTYTEDTVQPGTSLYQCCIHPWMRIVVNGKG